MVIETWIISWEIFIAYSSKLALVGPMLMKDPKKDMSIDFGNVAQKSGNDETKSDAAKAKDNSTEG